MATNRPLCSAVQDHCAIRRPRHPRVRDANHARDAPFNISVAGEITHLGHARIAFWAAVPQHHHPVLINIQCVIVMLAVTRIAFSSDCGVTICDMTMSYFTIPTILRPDPRASRFVRAYSGDDQLRREGLISAQEDSYAHTRRIGIVSARFVFAKKSLNEVAR